MTLWFPKWRSLRPWKGHLKHPKRSLGRTWYICFLVSLRDCHRCTCKYLSLKVSNTFISLKNKSAQEQESAERGRMEGQMLKEQQTIHRDLSEFKKDQGLMFLSCCRVESHVTPVTPCFLSIGFRYALPSFLHVEIVSGCEKRLHHTRCLLVEAFVMNVSRNCTRNWTRSMLRFWKIARQGKLCSYQHTGCGKWLAHISIFFDTVLTG